MTRNLNEMAKELHKEAMSQGVKINSLTFRDKSFRHLGDIGSSVHVEIDAELLYVKKDNDRIGGGGNGGGGGYGYNGEGGGGAKV